MNLIQNWGSEGEAMQPNNNSKVISNWDDDDNDEDQHATNLNSSSWGNTNQGLGNNITECKKVDRFGDKSDKPRPTGCFNCGKEGHYAKDCPEPKKERRPPRENRDNNRDRSDNKWENKESKDNSWGNSGGNSWGNA